MTFSKRIFNLTPTNIRVFRQLIKRLLLPHKRHELLFRSALFIILSNAPCFGSFEDLSTSARLTALADAGVAWPFGADCLFLNPAGLHSNGFDLHLFYSKPFGLNELHLGNCAVRYSTNRYTGALGIQNFGNSSYHENQVLAAVAVRFMPTVVLGGTCRIGSLAIDGYGHTTSILFDLGMTTRLHTKWFWGFSIKNAGNAKIGVSREALPTVLTTGFCFAPHRSLVLLFDVSKDTRFPLDIRCGIDYNVLPPLTLRLGVGNEPTRFGAGFSLFVNRFRFDYAFSSHLELGLTHMFSIGMS